ncbi:hypothetical protein HYT58_00465 [Candidatus Woesearchaeota archaeon]|nr:hypothetical protein [Candidatus Woesearchaeota archaeon]
MADKTVVLMILLVLALAFLFGSTGTTGNVPRINECTPGRTICANQASAIWICDAADATWDISTTRSEFLEMNAASISDPDQVDCIQDKFGARFVISQLNTAGTSIDDLGRVQGYNS